MRVLICGGRSYSNDKRMAEVLDAINAQVGVSAVIHGACKRRRTDCEGWAGADYLAGAWARANHVVELAFPANWDAHGRAAGPIRNGEMLRRAEPDIVLAFPGGDGTADMMEQALAAGVQVVRIEG